MSEMAEFSMGLTTICMFLAFIFLCARFTLTCSFFFILAGLFLIINVEWWSKHGYEGYLVTAFFVWTFIVIRWLIGVRKRFERKKEEKSA